MTRLIDLTGMTFGRLTVVKRSGSTKNGSGTAPTWECVCSCGTTHTVTGPALRSGQVKSCGCLTRKHMMYGTPEYNAWRSAISRCENKADRKFNHYGARGIAICAAWRQSFQSFYDSMGPRPSKHHSLDRIDVNGNYEPGNCRWATVKEQARNKRCSSVLTVNDESLTYPEWTERLGASKNTIRERLRRGWSTAEAVMTPAG